MPTSRSRFAPHKACSTTTRSRTIGAALAGAIVGLILGKNAATAILYALMGGAVGFLAPLYYITRRARMRQTAIARQLSDVLDLLVVCVEAGLGLFEAIKIVGIETRRQKQEIGEELSLVASEIQAGSSLGQALRARRCATSPSGPRSKTSSRSPRR